MRQLLREEIKLWEKGYKYVVGIDESGRGPLAGPVVACAVTIHQFLIDREFNNSIFSDLKDSKKLSPKKREKIFEFLKKHPAIEWGIGRAGNKVIDKINILEATKLAMRRAVSNLKSKLQMTNVSAGESNPISKQVFLLIDGNFGVGSFSPQGLPIPEKSVIKGDERIFLIKAASIMAKVSRDRIMQRYHKKYPKYGFDRHKGYPTREHVALLQRYGQCKIHRRSFRPVLNCLRFNI